jgi:hypothetical protein
LENFLKVFFDLPLTGQKDSGKIPFVAGWKAEDEREKRVEEAP